MMDLNRIFREYQRWLRYAVADVDVVHELAAMVDKPLDIEDAFYRDLEFGTGGLRGIIGAGINRMNVYTVAKASQGLANYVNQLFPSEQRKIAVSYDSRIKSALFARVACCVFAASGIHAMLYRELMPTPCLSYAVRNLGCAAGIMITASHNPGKYNGYKVYNKDGCQITTEAAEIILAEIKKLDVFADVKQADFEDGLRQGLISYISDTVYTGFIEAVKRQSNLFGEAIDKDVSIVYSPLNGTGLKPVLRTLRESGYTDINVVKEQEFPDGRFPTCPYPNPEIKEAMALGMAYSAKCNADLLLATDPDCDRVGIAVKDKVGSYQLLSGNETGTLLLEYICTQRIRHGRMPANPVIVKTIVTTDLAERIADHYGVKTINVLTGFKYIGEQIGLLESVGRKDDFVFGFEESYGYLSGSHVRDKDAVDGALLICEMFAYYKTHGISLLDKLNELYQRYGYCLNTLHTFTFEGAAGFAKMEALMMAFRTGEAFCVKRPAFGLKHVEKCLDFSTGLDGLPKSNMLKYLLEDNCSVVVRPSGTESKLKAYVSVSADNQDAAVELEKQIVETIREMIA